MTSPRPVNRRPAPHKPTRDRDLRVHACGRCGMAWGNQAIHGDKAIAEHQERLAAQQQHAGRYDHDTQEEEARDA